ncbi:inhibitor of growth protein [Salix suchowensis]|nr:inhibitor of growth protein [Salix suchowensis]
MSEGTSRDASPMCREEDIYQYGYPRCDTGNSMASSSDDSPFFGTFDTMSLLESGLYQQKYDDMSDHYRREQDKKWDSIDSRLLVLLEFFRELIIRKREVFKKLFPELHDEFLGLFKKMGNARALQRSLSVGSPRTPSRNEGESSLRLERFKIRTVIPDGGGQGDTSKGGGASSNGGQSK